MFADGQVIVNDLEDLDGAADDDDDELMIVKVESAEEREQSVAAKAQQELSRLQKQQLQAKFDLANHRKAQVRQTPRALPCPSRPLFLSPSFVPVPSFPLCAPHLLSRMTCPPAPSFAPVPIFRDYSFRVLG